jgi:ABC-type Mn2+/Zn2+ transport system permease subunit
MLEGLCKNIDNDYHFNLPSGPSIVVTQLAIFFGAIAYPQLSTFTGKI